MTHAAQFATGALTPGTVAAGSFDRLPPGGRILVPTKTAGLVRGSSLLPYDEQLKKPCVESYVAPFGCGHAIRKVRCWLECGFANGWSSNAPQCFWQDCGAADRGMLRGWSWQPSSSAHYNV